MFCCHYLGKVNYFYSVVVEMESYNHCFKIFLNQHISFRTLGHPSLRKIPQDALIELLRCVDHLSCKMFVICFVMSFLCDMIKRVIKMFLSLGLK